MVFGGQNTLIVHCICIRQGHIRQQNPPLMQHIFHHCVVELHPQSKRIRWFTEAEKSYKKSPERVRHLVRDSICQTFFPVAIVMDSRNLIGGTVIISLGIYTSFTKIKYFIISEPLESRKLTQRL